MPRHITPEDMDALFCSADFLARVEESGKPSAEVFQEATNQEVSAWIAQGRDAKMRILSSSAPPQSDETGLDSYETYSIRLEGQMMAIANLGAEFLRAIQRAAARGAHRKLVSDAKALMAELTGKPGDGALEVYRDLRKNIETTSAFLREWSSTPHQSDEEVLREAQRTLDALTYLQDLVDETPPHVMARIQSSVKVTRFLTGRRGCFGVVFAIVLGVVLLAWFMQRFAGTDGTSRSLWLDFGHVVATAALAEDYDKLLDGLSLYRVQDAEAFMQEVARTNPDVEWRRNDSTPSDSQARQAMSEDVKRFIESYGDLLDGQLACVTPARLALLKGVELYSVIVWVKKHEKFHGIKIDRVWKRGDQLKVVEWVSLSGYFLDPSHGTVLKKRAKLVADSIDDCGHPEEIEYEYQTIR